MGVKSWPGGFVQPIPPIPAGPFQDGAAKGVWNLDQVAYWLQQGLWPIAGNVAPIGFVCGGGSSNVISKITIATAGNATDFGDLVTATTAAAGLSSSVRGIVAGGFIGGQINVIQYITMSTAGNSVDYGDLNNSGYNRNPAGASNNTRGLIAGGSNSDPSVTANIQYITIASTGNSASFGNMDSAWMAMAACASTTRAVFAGGYNWGAYTNTMRYSTIGTLGNTITFGNLSGSVGWLAGAGSSTRGVFGGGVLNTGANTNVIQYITISSAGNSTDFGDLTVARQQLTACASSVRVVFAAGYTTTNVNVIDYVTTATTGDATDFGDLLVFQTGPAGFSNAHGGL